MQVQFFSPQFYVHINVELFLNAFMCWRKKRSLIELSNHIGERRCKLKANKRAGILWICYWLDGAARQLVANPDYTILLISYLILFWVQEGFFSCVFYTIWVEVRMFLKPTYVHFLSCSKRACFDVCHQWIWSFTVNGQQWFRFVRYLFIFPLFTE